MRLCRAAGAACKEAGDDGRVTSRMWSRPLNVFCLTVGLQWTFCAGGGHAAEPADALWGRILELDAGPREPQFAPEQTGQVVMRHLVAQEEALRVFISSWSSDPRAFEAGLRMARLQQIRADLEGAPNRLDEAARILEELGRRAVGIQTAEVEFAQLAMEMRTSRVVAPERREHLLGSARRFARRYPEDRRLGALYAEMASLFADQPKVMRTLLIQAELNARGEDLRRRIADDLKRVDWVGKELPLDFNGMDGEHLNVSGMKGGVGAVLFFSAGSPQSRGAIQGLKKAMDGLPKGALRVLAVSVDTRAEPVKALWREAGVDWPVAFDPAGWEAVGVRALGVNAIPVVWLLDRRGRLRSLVGLQATVTQVRQLLNER
jgi:hypothetical protein